MRGPTVMEKIKTVLEDGEVHGTGELKECLTDELALGNGVGAIAKHICILRKELNPKGLDIVFRAIRRRQFGYQMVRLIGSANRG